MTHAPTARLLGTLLTTLALGFGLMAVSAAPAHAGPDLTKPFTREPVKRGDVDADQYNIEHVYEVQIRLRRLGFLSASPNGTFGPLTERAVKRFQRDRGLRVTGQVGAKTWKPLIFRSTFGRAKVPARCKNARWRVCYDRKRHQASLYHNGTLHNSWLVRGGATTARPVSVTSRSSGGARTTRAAPTTARRCPTPSSSRAGRRCTGRAT